MFEAFSAGRLPVDAFKKSFATEFAAFQKPFKVIQEDLAKHGKLLQQAAASPAAPPPPPPAPPGAPPPVTPMPSSGGGRGALLSSIRQGGVGSLRKVTAADIEKMKAKQTAATQALAGNLEDTLKLAMAHLRTDMLEDDLDAWDDDDLESWA